MQASRREERRDRILRRLGKPVKKGYHSHYVVTSREGQVYKHFQNNSGSPSENGTDSEKGKEPERAESPKHKRVPKAYDEFVFFHEAQVFFVVQYFVPTFMKISVNFSR
jgi:hypothetical protein